MPELRAAVIAHDRLGAERWLAANLDDAETALFDLSAENFDDLGMKVIMTDTAIKLAKILGEQGRYAALRVAVWEMTAATNKGLRAEARSYTEALRARLVDNALAEKGAIESVQSVFLYDAAEGTNVVDRVRGYLAALPVREAPDVAVKKIDPPVYRLARDYGQHLRAFASGDERLQLATSWNLEQASSFVDWSFA